MVWLGYLVGGRVGRWFGDWVGGLFCKWGSFLVPVGDGPIPFVGTVFSFLRYDIPACSGEVRVRTNAFVWCCTYYCTAVAHDRWLGWWVDGLVGGLMCRVVRW